MTLTEFETVTIDKMERVYSIGDDRWSLLITTKDGNKFSFILPTKVYLEFRNDTH